MNSRRRRLPIKSLSFLFVVASLLSPSIAQRPQPPQPPTYDPKLISEIKAIQKAALESDYAYRQLAHLSNNIGARLSGSPQAQKAVEYTAAELRKLGLLLHEDAATLREKNALEITRDS